MAVSAINDNTKFYDPHYRPDAAGLQAGSRNRRYDDFSVSGHLHILRPQLVSLSSNSIQESVQTRNTSAGLYKKSQTLPSAFQRPKFDQLTPTRGEALGKTTVEWEVESKT